MLRARWLGRVPYGDADQLQRALHERAADDYLLLLEHPHVYTLGTTADPAHVLVPPATVGAELVHADRGGDVTYHGPGQLVGYPIVTLPEWRDGQRDVVAYVRTLEDVAHRRARRLGIAAHREPRLTGVWVGDEKIAAIGVKVARGRTRHGFALNVDPDLVDVRAHRAVRHPRPRRHVDGRAAGRRAVDRGRRRLASTRSVDDIVTRAVRTADFGYDRDRRPVAPPRDAVIGVADCGRGPPRGRRSHATPRRASGRSGCG